MVEVDRPVVVAADCKIASMAVQTVVVPSVVVSLVVVSSVVVSSVAAVYWIDNFDEESFESYATVEDMTGMIALEFVAMLELQCFVDFLHRVHI